MKMYNEELAYLRSIIGTDIITVPDREMNNFIQATQTDDERLHYLNYTDFLNKEGRKVRVIAGDFMGIEGEIKRIKKDRCVVVLIRGIAAVALQIPFSDLEFEDGRQ